MGASTHRKECRAMLFLVSLFHPVHLVFPKVTHSTRRPFRSTTLGKRTVFPPDTARHPGDYSLSGGPVSPQCSVRIHCLRRSIIPVTEVMEVMSIDRKLLLIHQDLIIYTAYVCINL